MLSISEENYLKAIFKISERKGTPVSTNAIAKELDTSAASVTDMIKKLAAKSMIHYEKYHGVNLSTDGTKVATQLVRKHRLWETFLVDTLKFTWSEVHEIAEQLEHINSNNLIDRLDAFLGHPRFDPHGDPIPDDQGKFVLRKQHLLTDLSVGEEGIVVRVQNHDREFLDFLAQFSLNIGTKIKVVERLDFDASMKIMIDGREPTIISKPISKNVYVRKI